jgi:fucose permease
MRSHDFADSHRNGLNILPSYTDYFHLNTATMSLSTAALWIGGAIAGLTYGQVTDMIGRRYALFWAALGTLLSVVLQTAAQNTAMFVIARILVGYGTSASTLTGPTYLAETLPYHWRAWGLGVLNDCYYVGTSSIFLPDNFLTFHRRAHRSWGDLPNCKLQLNLGLASPFAYTRSIQHPVHRDPALHTRIAPLVDLYGP